MLSFVREITAALVVVGAVCSIALAQTQEKKTPTERYVVKQHQFVDQIDAKGTLDSAETATVVSRLDTNSVILALAEPGKRIEKGQIVVRLEDSKPRESVAQQKLAVYQQQQGLVAAEALLQRARTSLALAEDKQDDKQDAEAEVRSAEVLVASQQATVDLEKIRLQRAEQQLQACTVVAPCDGTVVYASISDTNGVIEQGASVRPGQTIARIVNLRRLQLRTIVSETHIGQIRVGQESRILLPTIFAEPFDGEVTHISTLPIPRDKQTSDPSLRDYEVTVALKINPVGVRIGMAADVSIAVGEFYNVLLVPRAALRPAKESNLTFCIVIEDDGPVAQQVTVGRTFDHEMIEITEGLEAGFVVLVAIE